MVILADDVVLLAVVAPLEYHLVREAGGPPALCKVQSAGGLRPGVACGQYPVDRLLNSLTVHRSVWRVKLISPALRTTSPPAQATYSLRRGARLSTPPLPRT
ncbi:hypothetical protein GCM10010273_43440 [Streptomyces lavendulocolor]